MAHTLATTQAWNEVLRLVRPPDAEPTFDAALWKAVLAFAATLPPPKSVANPAAPTPAKPHTARNSAGEVTRSGHVSPFGTSKGLPIEELVDRDLAFLLRKAEADQLDPDKEKWHAKNLPYLQALRTEAAAR